MCTSKSIYILMAHNKLSMIIEKLWLNTCVVAVCNAKKKMIGIWHMPTSILGK